MGGTGVKIRIPLFCATLYIPGLHLILENKKKVPLRQLLSSKWKDIFITP